jgi:hypothetical protein
MSALPIFKLKHYRSMMDLVRKLDEPTRSRVADMLCEAFSRDNPNFSREKFLTCLGEQDENTKTQIQPE